MKKIRIDWEGDGDWVMSRVTGVFTPGYDHSFVTYNGDQILGGFVICHYLGASATVHMAADTPGWNSRDLMWLLFDYAFNQLYCRKVIAPVRSNHATALDMDKRAGFKVEAVITRAFPDADLVLLTMEKQDCKWLKIRPQSWITGSLSREG